ncbi:MAG: PD40 domain-containing protein [Deltaproteobacteria bacterium]|nr:PD40 domain-containing protein [Deltaproteobacteria bacterium]
MGPVECTGGRILQIGGVLAHLDSHINRIGEADGYDGGPFFSPDQKRICYRSDRKGDHLLQLFVSDLAFNENGTIVGVGLGGSAVEVGPVDERRLHGDCSGAGPDVGNLITGFYPEET